MKAYWLHWMVLLSDHGFCDKQGNSRRSLENTHQTLSTGVPQGCALSPLFFSLCTYNCVFNEPTVKFADHSTVVGLIDSGAESAYRKEIGQLVSWCSSNYLLLNGKDCRDGGRFQPPASTPPTNINSFVLFKLKCLFNFTVKQCKKKLINTTRLARIS